MYAMHLRPYKENNEVVTFSIFPPRQGSRETSNTSKPINSNSLLQLLKAGMHQLVLQDVTLATSGRFMCQVTESRAPFHTEEREKNLTVISE